MKETVKKNFTKGTVFIFAFIIWTMLIQTSDFNRVGYWGLIVSLVLMGVAKFIMTRLRLKRGQTTVTTLSLVIGIIAVLFFAMAREAYGAVILFLMVVAKWMLIYKMR